MGGSVALLASPAGAGPALTAAGTEFVLTLADGRVLRGAALVGATLLIGIDGRAAELTIAAVEPDRAAVNGPILLHDFRVSVGQAPPTPFCAPDAEGRRLGFPVPDGQGGFTLACTSGAIGKCIRWGYRPWDERPGGPPLAALHQACVHLARADYGGDGQSFTQDGTLIDLYDRFGIQQPANAPGLSFEAAWGSAGALCVARPRLAERISLAALAERYPKLQGRLGPAACTEAAARADPAALLFNRSR